MAFRLESPAFHDKTLIPKKYTGEGSDVSPPLRWNDLPPNTKELAILCEDPDAPQEEPFVHWIAYKISPDRGSLPEGLPQLEEVDGPLHILQGTNSFDHTGYEGPMPPKRHGTHRYFFRLYALDSALPYIPGIDKDTFTQMIRGHVLAEAQLVGTYERH